MKLFPLLVAVLAVPVLAAGQTKTLADLERVSKELSASVNPFQDDEKRSQLFSDLQKLVESDVLKSGEEFRRAANLIPYINARMEQQQVRYELTMIGMTLGDAQSADQLKVAWDQFILSTGRQQHLGSLQSIPGIEDDAYKPNLTVACVRNVLLNPAKAREDVKKLTPNKEFQALVDEDQKVRQGDWSKHTQAESMAIYKADIDRRKKLKGLLDKIDLMTAQDYANASLIMQHGNRFDDYALAHELALCSTVLDPKTGRQLVALTYDRMLESGGYQQRVGTQYHGVTLSKVNTTGFSDTMRKTLGRKPLAEVPKTIGGY